jgi:putative transposase
VKKESIPCRIEKAQKLWKTLHDPRDMAEIRVFYHDAFLCRAICAELAGQTISLKEIQAARTAQRKTLRETLTDRQQVVERYLAVHRPPAPSEVAPEPSTPPPPRLKRYLNE